MESGVRYKHQNVGIVVSETAMLSSFRSSRAREGSLWRLPKLFWRFRWARPSLAIC